MLILEKTATSTRQVTPYLEYENVIVENIGGYPVKILAYFHDLRKKMIDAGAVEDTVEPYGQNVYEGMKPRVRTRFFGLIKTEIREVGYVSFISPDGDSAIRIKAYNGHAVSVRGGASIRAEWYDRNAVSIADYFQADTAPHAVTTRVTYTCPSGKIALIEICNLTVTRLGAADPTAGVVEAIMEFTPYSAENGTMARPLYLTFTNNTVGTGDRMSIGATMVMQAGDVFTLRSGESGSNGGLVRYVLGYKGTEFDA